MLLAGLERADAMLAEAVDRVKTARGDRPLVVVGGGSVLVPDRLPGVSEVIRPPHHDVANAIGAAIAAVSGQIDRIYHAGDARPRRAAGRRRRTRPGPRPSAPAPTRPGWRSSSSRSCPLAYLTTPSVRIRAKAAGPLLS